MSNKSAYHDCSSINHWIVRSSIFIEDWSIEGYPTWLLSYELMNLISNQIMKESISNYFANGLYREDLVRVSKLNELSISWAEACCKPLRISFSKRRYIRGYCTLWKLSSRVIFDGFIGCLKLQFEASKFGNSHVCFKNSLQVKQAMCHLGKLLQRNGLLISFYFELLDKVSYVMMIIHSLNIYHVNDVFLN